MFFVVVCLFLIERERRELSVTPSAPLARARGLSQYRARAPAAAARAVRVRRARDRRLGRACLWWSQVSTVALYLRKNRACVFNVTTLRFTSTPHTRDAAHAHSTQTTHGTHTHDTVEPDSRETRHTPSQCDQLHLLRACLRAATGYIDLGDGVPAGSAGGYPAAR